MMGCTGMGLDGAGMGLSRLEIERSKTGMDWEYREI